MTSKEEPKRNLTAQATSDALNNLQKFIEKQEIKQSNPPLSDCIKEWEERDFAVANNSINYLHVRNYTKNISVLFRKFELSYKVESFYDDEDILVVSYDIHNLIHKTLKALEEMKNDNN